MLIEDPAKRIILIVDDEPGIRTLLKYELNLKGYPCLTAENGAQAVSLLAQQGPSIYLVLLDLKMPEMDGIEVVKHLTNTHHYPVGIYLITGYPSPEIVSEFYRLRTDTIIPAQFFQKPFILEKVLSEVTNTINLIHEKRMKQIDVISTASFRQLNELKNQSDLAGQSLLVIKHDLTEIMKHQNALSQQEKMVERINLSTQTTEQQLLTINLKMDQTINVLPAIQKDLNKIAKSEGILPQLGIELLKAVIIAVAVISFLFFGIDKFIGKIIR